MNIFSAISLCKFSLDSLSVFIQGGYAAYFGIMCIIGFCIILEKLHYTGEVSRKSGKIALHIRYSF